MSNPNLVQPEDSNLIASDNFNRQGNYTMPGAFMEMNMSTGFQNPSNMPMNNNYMFNTANQFNRNLRNDFSPNYLHPKNEKLKWRNIMKLDIDTLRRSNDLSLLEANLENLLYSNITEDDVSSVPEGNVVKLVRLLQFISEYLLNSQNKLEETCAILQDENMKLNNDNLIKDAKLKENKDCLTKLKKEKKRDQMVLLTYKNVIDNINKKNIKYTEYNINSNVQGTNQQYRPGNYSCKYCTAKIFNTEYDLQKHMHDVHQEGKSPKIEGNNYNFPQPQMQQPQINVQIPPANTDFLAQRIENMQNEFNALFKKLQDDNYKQLLENAQRANENPLKSDMEKMEKNFKEKITEMKELFLLELQKQNNQRLIDDKPPQIITKEVVKDNSDIKMLLEENMKKVNTNIQDMNRDSQERANKLSDEISKIKQQQTIIKSEWYEKIEKILSPEKPKPQKPEEPHKKPVNVIQSQGSEMFRSEKKKVVDVSYAEPVHKFNAGKLEIDNDDEIQLLKAGADIIGTIANGPVIVEHKGGVSLPGHGGVVRNKGEYKPDKLENFYKKYIKRDAKFMADPKLKMYLKGVLPENAPIDENNCQRELHNLMNATADGFYKQTKNPRKINVGADLSNLEKERKEDLMLMINDTFNQMEHINRKEQILSDYYTCIDKALQLSEIKKDNIDLYNKTMSMFPRGIRIQNLKQSYDENLSDANRPDVVEKFRTQVNFNNNFDPYRNHSNHNINTNINYPYNYLIRQAQFSGTRGTESVREGEFEYSDIQKILSRRDFNLRGMNNNIQINRPNHDLKGYPVRTEENKQYYIRDYNPNDYRKTGLHDIPRGMEVVDLAKNIDNNQSQGFEPPYDQVNQYPNQIVNQKGLLKYNAKDLKYNQNTNPYVWQRQEPPKINVPRENQIFKNKGNSFPKREGEFDPTYAQKIYNPEHKTIKQIENQLKKEEQSNGIKKEPVQGYTSNNFPQGYTGGNHPEEQGYTGGNQPQEKGYTGGNQPQEQGYTGGNHPEEQGYYGGNHPEEKGYTGGNHPQEQGYTGGNHNEEQGYSSGNHPEEQGYSSGNHPEEQGYTGGNHPEEKGYTLGNQPVQGYSSNSFNQPQPGLSAGNFNQPQNEPGLSSGNFNQSQQGQNLTASNFNQPQPGLSSGNFNPQPYGGTSYGKTGMNFPQNNYAMTDYDRLNQPYSSTTMGNQGFNNVQGTYYMNDTVSNNNYGTGSNIYMTNNYQNQTNNIANTTQQIEDKKEEKKDEPKFETKK